MEQAGTTTIVRVSRRFAAPVERLFDAWLNPARAGRWLFATPAGESVAVAIDARVGGSFIFTECRDGEDIEHTGEYLELNRPQRLSFRFAVPKYSTVGTRVTVEFAPHGPGAELTLTHAGVLPAMAERTAAGWRAVLDGLGATESSMQLLHSPTSPYARKVRVVACEKGLGERLLLENTSQWPDPARVAAFNPLGKVPVLVLDGGAVLYDSPVICEYLDALGDGPALVPARGSGRWRVLRQQSLADGLLDIAVGLVLERRRPAAEQSAVTSARATDALRRAVAALPAELAPAGAPFDLGQIALAVAVGYLEFRLGDLGLLDSERAVADWWRSAGARPSLEATRPPA